MQSLGPLKEPKEKEFRLWVDLYELISFNVPNVEKKNVWVTICQGEKKSEPIEARPHFKTSTNSYVFVTKKVDEIT